MKFLGFIMKSKKDQTPPPPTKDQELLMEIRDLLKKNAIPHAVEADPNPKR